MLKNLTRIIAGAALLASTSGCYSFALNGKELTKPVSMSASIGRPVTVTRHFRHDFVITWYLLGLLPMATVPGGPVPIATPANKLVEAILKEELKDGDGVVNLRVSHGMTVPSVLISMVVGIIPVVGTAVSSLFTPWGVTIEGDIVRAGGRGQAPNGPMVTLKDGELDMAGIDINAMIREAAPAVRSAQATH